MTPPHARQIFADATVAALRADTSRIVLTGASGWLGLATLELLHNALGDRFADRVRCYGSRHRRLTLRSGVSIDQQPLARLPELEARPTLVLHLAFLTKDRVAGMDADDYAAANAALSALVLDALDPIGATGVFVASSGAARFADDPNAEAAMRLYGSLKRRDETAFADWAERRGRVAVVTRIFNVAGPYINKHQAYALASFINDALAGRAIEVRAPHRVVRGYVAIRDLMSLVFLLLLGDGQVSRFDTSGTPLELAEVAAAVACEIGGVPVTRAPISNDRVDSYCGDAAEFDRLCAHYGIAAVPLAEQIRDTADSLIAASEPCG